MLFTCPLAFFALRHARASQRQVDGAKSASERALASRAQPRHDRPNDKPTFPENAAYVPPVTSQQTSAERIYTPASLNLTEAQGIGHDEACHHEFAYVLATCDAPSVEPIENRFAPRKHVATCN